MTNSTKVKKSQIKGVYLRFSRYSGFTNRSEFDASEHLLLPGKTLHLGQFINGSKAQDRVYFKSKAVSKSHADIWVEKNGKCYIRDTKSSTGTFLNSLRLSLANQSSEPFLLEHGDILQLGMNYYENGKVMNDYVKVKICLRSTSIEMKSKSSSKSIKPKKKLDNCCFCLNKMLRDEHLFVTPCSHMFHSKCCVPFFKSRFPFFVCPLCREQINDDDLYQKIRRELIN